MKQKVDRKFRLARIWSNQELRKISGLFTGKIINVSAGENEDKEGGNYRDYFPNARQYWISNYQPGAYRGYMARPNELLIDLEKPLNKEFENAFDVVFNHTTLEHVFDVFSAFKNLCKISNDVVIVVVPFVQEQHENDGYRDYWRFTPTCLRKLFELNGFQTIYESANNDFNAATYLFFVGSRYPEKWNVLMPAYEPLVNSGNWIGTGTRTQIRDSNNAFKNFLFLCRTRLKY